MGALESVQAQVSSQTSSLSFESRLLDEYLRSQSLQPNQPGSGKATAGLGPHGTAEAAAATAVHTGQATCVGAGVAAAAPVRPLSSGMRQQQSADFTDLPLIDEGVEEVEEGMDGERLPHAAFPSMVLGDIRGGGGRLEVSASHWDPTRSSLTLYAGRFAMRMCLPAWCCVPQVRTWLKKQGSCTMVPGGQGAAAQRGPGAPHPATGVTGV